MQQRALPLKDNSFRMIEQYRLKSSFWSLKEGEKDIRIAHMTRLEEKSGRPPGSCVFRISNVGIDEGPKGQAG